MMFSIPWKHAARHGWEVDKDACLFKQWAIHTGEALDITHLTVQQNKIPADDQLELELLLLDC